MGTRILAIKNETNKCIIIHNTLSLGPLSVEELPSINSIMHVHVHVNVHVYVQSTLYITCM